MDESRKSIRELIDQLMLSIIYDIYAISFSEGSIYRRGARRWRKLYRVNGHIFQAKRFNRVSIISFNYHCTIYSSPPHSPPPPPPFSLRTPHMQCEEIGLSHLRHDDENESSVYIEFFYGTLPLFTLKLAG